MAGSVSASTALMIAAGTAALSAGVGAMGAIQQGEAQSNAMKAQADANRYNATIAKNNADAANQQASAKEDLQRRHFAQVQGEANAAVAESHTGFLGTSADVLKQNAINNELDALNIRYEGQQKASGLISTQARTWSMRQMQKRRVTTALGQVFCLVLALLVTITVYQKDR
jgi:hypothetical protein